MQTLSKQLSELPLDDHLEYHLGDLVESWRVAGIGFEAVVPILEFIEAHPEEDFGAPGHVTHFVEEFFGKGYEEKLFESVERRPTTQTVIMLNRVINGSKTLAARERALDVMRRAKEHAISDQLLRNLIDEHLQFQTGRLKR